MKQIIVPTDFSEGAWNALLYAAELGDVLDVREIQVINSYQAPHSGAATLVSIDRIMQQDSEDGLNQLMDKIKETGLSARFNFHIKSIHSSLVTAINSLVKDYNDNLVVMGSLGQTGRVEKLFGSNATDVAGGAKCPVIIVPPHVKFTNLKNVVLGSDYHQVADRNLKILKTISEWDPSTMLKIVHVIGEGETPGGAVSMGLSQEDIAHEVLEIPGEKVGDALDEYVSSNDCDMLVLIKMESGFFEGLFHRSVTKKMALVGHVPLLILRRVD